MRFNPSAANRQARRRAEAISRRDPEKLRDRLREHQPLIKQTSLLVALVLAGNITPAAAYEQCSAGTKGMLPKLLHDNGASPEMMREILKLAWDASHAAVAGFQKTGELIQLFKHAEFPIPDWLPKTMPVWRGTVGLTVEQARRGYSWSLHRGCACHFALVHWQKAEGLKGRPLVLRREVRRQDLVYFHQNETSPRGFYSEVLVHAPPAGEVDGTEADWRQSMIDLYGVGIPT